MYVAIAIAIAIGTDVKPFYPAACTLEKKGIIDGLGI